jgi:hypothetical protein
MQIELAVIARFRALILAAIQGEIDALAATFDQGTRLQCCGRSMRRHDARPVHWITWVGWVRVVATRFRCLSCNTRRRPLLEHLEVEPGQVSGLLARWLGLLGCIGSCSLAAELAQRLLGVKVNAMTVWRAIQRLGEAMIRHTEAATAFYADSRSDTATTPTPPAAVVVSVDGCMLGMQVRSKRRHRKTRDEILPPLPPAEDGHFQEVKTGVILLPTDRTEISPGRPALVRKVLVSCLGDADAIFNLLIAKLRERGWLDANTVVVIVGDGSEWIWKRAELFLNRCEILDFWHAMEYAWAYAHAQFGEGSTVAGQWTRRIARDLKAGKVHEVIARLDTLHPVSNESRKALAALRKYYSDNAARMKYDEYLRLGYGIGSGSVESAHKQVVHARLRQAGMRWSVLGARRLLALRLLLLNGDWDMTERLRMVRFAA